MESAKWKSFSFDEIVQKYQSSASLEDFIVSLGYQVAHPKEPYNIFRSIKRCYPEIGWLPGPMQKPVYYIDNAHVYINNRLFSTNELQEICNTASSYNDFAKKLWPDTPNSGNLYKRVHRLITELHLDCNHFTGQAWKLHKFDLTRFKDYTTCPKEAPRTRSLYDALEYLRGHHCENPLCNATEHCGLPVPLEIHHVDGNKLNNTLENLQLLCPTCHAMTDNYRGRNTVPDEYVSDEVFAAALSASRSIKQALDRVHLSVQGSTYERARRLIDEYDITHLKIRDQNRQKNKELKQSQKGKKISNRTTISQIHNTQVEPSDKTQHSFTISEQQYKIIRRLLQMKNSELFFEMLDNLLSFDLNQLNQIQNTINTIQDTQIQRKYTSKKPSRDNLIKALRSFTSFIALGEHYGVSDSAVKKWCREYSLPDSYITIRKIPEDQWATVCQDWDAYQSKYEKPIKYSQVTHDDVKIIVKMYVDDKMTMSEIAEKLHFDRMTIRNVLRSQYVEIYSHPHAVAVCCPQLNIEADTITNMAHMLQAHDAFKNTQIKTIARQITRVLQHKISSYKGLTFVPLD